MIDGDVEGGASLRVEEPAREAEGIGVGVGSVFFSFFFLFFVDGADDDPSAADTTGGGLGDAVDVDDGGVDKMGENGGEGAIVEEEDDDDEESCVVVSTDKGTDTAATISLALATRGVPTRVLVVMLGMVAEGRLTRLVKGGRDASKAEFDAFDA